jgi:Nuclear condensing complex subunits, C-term domain
MDISNNSFVAQAFDSAQKSISSQTASIKLLERSFASNSNTGKEFVSLLDRLLLIPKQGDGIILRLCEFILKACELEESVLLKPSIDHLMSRFDCKDKLIRQRSIQITSCLLTSNSLSDALSKLMETPLLEKLLDSVSSRCFDKYVEVRSFAVRALGAINLGNETLIEVFKSDPSPSVRALAVASLGITPQTLPLVLSQRYSTSSQIRQAVQVCCSQLTLQRYAFECESLKHAKNGASNQLLSPYMRSELILSGLTDMTKEVSQSALQHLLLWFALPSPAGCGWDWTKLIESISLSSLRRDAQDPWLISNDRLAEIVLFHLFSFAEAGSVKGKSASPAAPSAATLALVPLNLPSQFSLPNLQKQLLALISRSSSRTMPEVDSETVLLWRVRAAWLAGSGSADAAPGLGAAHAEPLCSKIRADVREAALDELLPSSSEWLALLQNVLSAGFGVDLPDQLTDSVTPKNIEVPLLVETQLAIAIPDQASLSMLRQVLLLGQLCDFSDVSSRSSAISALSAAMLHPAVPVIFLSLLCRLAAIVTGATLAPVEAIGKDVHKLGSEQRPSQEAVKEYLDLVSSCSSRMVLASKDPFVLRGMSSGGVSGDHSSGLNRGLAQARIEEIRIILEESSSSASTSAHEGELDSLRSELERLEESLVGAVGDNNRGTSSLIHSGYSGETADFTASQLSELYLRKSMALFAEAMQLLPGTVPSEFHPVLLSAFSSALTSTGESEDVWSGIFYPCFLRESLDLKLVGLRCCALFALNQRDLQTAASLGAIIAPVSLRTMLASDQPEELRILSLQVLGDLALAVGPSALLPASASKELGKSIASLLVVHDRTKAIASQLQATAALTLLRLVLAGLVPMSDLALALSSLIGFYYLCVWQASLVPAPFDGSSREPREDCLDHRELSSLLQSLSQGLVAAASLSPALKLACAQAAWTETTNLYAFLFDLAVVRPSEVPLFSFVVAADVASPSNDAEDLDDDRRTLRTGFGVDAGQELNSSQPSSGATSAISSLLSMALKFSLQLASSPLQTSSETELLARLVPWARSLPEFSDLPASSCSHEAFNAIVLFGNLVRLCTEAAALLETTNAFSFPPLVSPFAQALSEASLDLRAVPSSPAVAFAHAILGVAAAEMAKNVSVNSSRHETVAVGEAKAAASSWVLPKDASKQLIASVVGEVGKAIKERAEELSQGPLALVAASARSSGSSKQSEGISAGRPPRKAAVAAKKKNLEMEALMEEGAEEEAPPPSRRSSVQAPAPTAPVPVSASRQSTPQRRVSGVSAGIGPSSRRQSRASTASSVEL